MGQQNGIQVRCFAGTEDGKTSDEDDKTCNKDDKTCNKDGGKTDNQNCDTGNGA